MRWPTKVNSSLHARALRLAVAGALLALPMCVSVACKDESTTSQSARPALPIHDYTKNLMHPDEEKRREAFRALASLGKDSEPAIPALLEALESPDSKVHNSAAQVLGGIGPAAVQTLHDTFNNSLDPRVQSGCAQALGETGAAAKGSLTDLENALEDPAPAVRAAAALAIGRIIHDVNLSMPAQEIKISNPDLADFAKRLVATGSGTGISAQVEERQAQRGQYRDVFDQFGIDHSGISQMPDEAPPETVLRVNWGGDLPPVQEIVTKLAGMLYYDDNAAAREAAAESLGLLGPAATGATETLLEALHDGGGDVKYKAVWALGEIRPPGDRVTRRLAIFSSDGDEKMRRLVAAALFKIEGE